MSRSIDKTALSRTIISADAREKGDPMDIESRLTEIEERLARIESEVHRTRTTITSTVLGPLLLLTMAILMVEESRKGGVLTIIIVGTMVGLLVWTAWGLQWLIWARRAEETRRHEKMMRDLIAIAEQARTQPQDHS
jgi:hypothetical protein